MRRTGQHGKGTCRRRRRRCVVPSEAQPAAAGLGKAWRRRRGHLLWLWLRCLAPQGLGRSLLGRPLRIHA